MSEYHGVLQNRVRSPLTYLQPNTVCECRTFSIDDCNENAIAYHSQHELTLEDCEAECIHKAQVSTACDTNVEVTSNYEYVKSSYHVT